MKLSSKISRAFSLVFFLSCLYAQEMASKWDVELVSPTSVSSAKAPILKPQPAKRKILSSHTKKIEVTEAPEMHDLPSIKGKINVTVQLVEEPNFLDDPPPLPILPPESPAVLANLAELRRLHQGTELIFLSATVYDHKYTFLQIFPNGKVDQMVSAWSNLDFHHFCGFSTFRVKHGTDNTYYDYGLLMGIGSTNQRHRVQQSDKRKIASTGVEIPQMPDLAINGPSFVVVDGDQKSPAIFLLEQLHNLYRKEGAKMEHDYNTREKARVERKAYLLANPPKPADVTIQFWKRDTPSMSDVKSTKKGGFR